MELAAALARVAAAHLAPLSKQSCRVQAETANASVSFSKNAERRLVSLGVRAFKSKILPDDLSAFSMSD